MVLVVIALATLVVSALSFTIGPGGGCARTGVRGSGVRRSATVHLKDLLEFAPVEPNPPTLGAHIDLNAKALNRLGRNIAVRAQEQGQFGRLDRKIRWSGWRIE